MQPHTSDTLHIRRYKITTRNDDDGDGDNDDDDDGGDDNNISDALTTYMSLSFLSCGALGHVSV
jgi:hypothetical protein